MTTSVTNLYDAAVWFLVATPLSIVAAGLIIGLTRKSR